MMEFAIRTRSSQVDLGYCRLLSLPKEIRLEIWKYTVTDPSVDRPVIRIDREYSPSPITESPPNKRSCNSLHQYTRFHSLVKATFEDSRHCCLGVQLLRSNSLVYHEALPLLYHSVIFFPCQTSVFPEFLASLSDLAKQHVRYVRLSIDSFSQPRHHVDWALLCAQTAGLPCLRQVEVLYSSKHRRGPEIYKKRLLGPLLKITVPKKLMLEGDDDFQRELIAVDRLILSQKVARKERAELEAAKQNLWQKAVAEDNSVFSEEARARRIDSIFMADKQIVVNRQDAQEGPGQDEADWDVVSINSIVSGISSSASQLVSGTKRTRSQSDDEGSDSGKDDDWILID